MEQPVKGRYPDDINLLHMIESRISEIIQIEKECKRKAPKLYNQRLPRFMRRRAASHNPKRIPKKNRPVDKSSYGTKSRKKLLVKRRRFRFRKNKRVLRKHCRHKFKDTNKSLLHKWFAKRFKMGTDESFLHIPMFNSTKNQRNLSRQSKFGCAYLSLAHLVSIELTLASFKDVCDVEKQLEALNQLANQVSGFTFLARALEQGHYELVIHLYKPDSSWEEYVCPALVSLHRPPSRSDDNARLTLWVPREKSRTVFEHLQAISDNCEPNFDVRMIKPVDSIRIRLVGPNAHSEADKIATGKAKHENAIKDATMKLDTSFGLTIGRHLEEKLASFTYYRTYPLIVDIVLRTAKGRMLWHKFIKNKAHLVGGYRDIERVLSNDCFRLSPDF